MQPSFKFAVVVTLVLLSVAIYLLYGTTSLRNAPSLGKDQLRPSDLLAHNHAAETAGLLQAYVEASCKLYSRQERGIYLCGLLRLASSDVSAVIPLLERPAAPKSERWGMLHRL